MTICFTKFCGNAIVHSLIWKELASDIWIDNARCVGWLDEWNELHKSASSSHKLFLNRFIPNRAIKTSLCSTTRANTLYHRQILRILWNIQFPERANWRKAQKPKIILKYKSNELVDAGLVLSKAFQCCNGNGCCWLLKPGAKLMLNMFLIFVLQLYLFSIVICV